MTKIGSNDKPNPPRDVQERGSNSAGKKQRQELPNLNPSQKVERALSFGSVQKVGPWAHLVAKGVVAGATGAGPALLALSPLVDKPSTTIATAAGGVALTALPLYADLLPFLGAEVKGWNDVALKITGLKTADIDHQVPVTEAVERKVKTFEYAWGAVVNGALGGYMSGVPATAGAVVGGCLLVLTTSLTAKFVGARSIRALSGKKAGKSKEGQGYDLGSVDVKARNKSRRMLAKSQQGSNWITVGSCLLAASAGFGAIAEAAVLKHREDPTGFNDYVGEHLAPAAVNFVTMTLYLVAFARTVAALPKSKALVVAAVERNNAKTQARVEGEELEPMKGDAARFADPYANDVEDGGEGPSKRRGKPRADVNLDGAEEMLPAQPKDRNKLPAVVLQPKDVEGFVGFTEQDLKKGKWPDESIPQNRKRLDEIMSALLAEQQRKK